MKIFLSYLLFFFLISCDRLEIPPRPHHIPPQAKYNRKKHLWEYRDKNWEVIWFQNGQLFRKVPLQNGLYNGNYIQYFKNGKISQQGIYKKGFRTGKWIYYFPSGNPYLILHYQKEPYDPERFYPNGDFGNENGIYIRYYEDGIIEEKGLYFAGKFHKKRIHYYRNGQIQFIARYQKGKKIGKWQYYGPEGNLIREEWYQNDLLQKVIRYTYKNHKLSMEFPTLYKNN